METYAEETGFKEIAPLSKPRWYPAAVHLNDGRVIAIGGIATSDALIAGIELIIRYFASEWHLSGIAVARPP